MMTSLVTIFLRLSLLLTPGSKEDRRAKLEMYLKDFDLQTTNYVKAMQAREKEMIHKLEQEWVLHRLKIPPQVRLATF